MKSNCKKCGKCCEAIIIGVSHKEMFEGYPRGGDYKFVRDNWEPLSMKEALNINPKLKEWIYKNRPNIGKTDRSMSIHFYRCKRYDSKNKLCLVHESRPDVCKEFPFYERPTLPKGYLFYSEECGYNIPESFETPTMPLDNDLMNKNTQHD